MAAISTTVINNLAVAKEMIARRGNNPPTAQEVLSAISSIQDVITSLNLIVGSEGEEVLITGNQTIAGTKTFSSTISGAITGNAGTVTNGVYTNADNIFTTQNRWNAFNYYAAGLMAALGNSQVTAAAIINPTNIVNTAIAVTAIGLIMDSGNNNIDGVEYKITNATSVTLTLYSDVGGKMNNVVNSSVVILPHTTSIVTCYSNSWWC